MGFKDYPDMFYNYAFSGKAPCNACENKITQGQHVFVFKGNLYHDVCSKDLKERKNLREEKFKRPKVDINKILKNTGFPKRLVERHYLQKAMKEKL